MAVAHTASSLQNVLHRIEAGLIKSRGNDLAQADLAQCAVPFRDLLFSYSPARFRTSGAIFVIFFKTTNAAFLVRYFFSKVQEQESFERLKAYNPRQNIPYPYVSPIKRSDL